MATVSDIIATADERTALYSPLHNGMEEVRKVYEGELTIELPEVDGQTKPPIPNLLAQGVDQVAGRIASVIPTITVVPATESRTAQRRARTAERALGAWWTADRLNLKLVQRARHLIAYGLTSTIVTWDHKAHRPTWEHRSPLSLLPNPNMRLDRPVPDDAMWQYSRTAGWLKKNGYGAQLGTVTNWREHSDHDRFTVVEYIDSEIRALILKGSPESLGGRPVNAVLEFYEHGLGCPQVTVTPRTGLERLTGQFTQMISMYEAEAQLMALEIIAVEKGIFPDTYLVSRPGEIGRFIDGPHDGRTGRVNVVTGGDIRTETYQPGYLTNPTIDRLERNQRVDGGLPAEFGGESQSNVRTGRRGDAILSAAIDVPIAYAQNLIAAALEEENRLASKLARKYDGPNSRTFTVGLGNSRSPVTFTADVVFGADDMSQVSYPVAGTDANSLIINLGQRVGMGLMSKETAAYLDPMIPNPEVEHDNIISEGLEQALVTSIQQQAASGQIPPLVVARIADLVKRDRKELAGAVEQVTKEAIAEQQAKAEQQAQGGQMGMPSPAGLSAEPAQAALAGAVASPIPGTTPGQDELASLLGKLRQPVMGVTPDVGVGGRV